MIENAKRRCFRPGLVLLAGVAALCLSACGKSPEVQAPTTKSPAADPAEIAALTAHTREFRRRIEQVNNQVWMAIGYGLANSILIEGNDGLIVIDTMETLETGRQVALEFDKISDKPLKAIIYTHNHADHVFGAQAFIEVLGDPQVPVTVMAHATTAAYVHRVISEYRPILSARSYRMFGVALEKNAYESDGIGMELTIDKDSTFGFVNPTRTFDDTLDITIAGVALQLRHAPGETDDQIFVWVPALKMLALGDNMYKAFPNLYTIRGTTYRSLKQWAASLDLMRALPVEVVTPSHGSPLAGAEFVYQTLTDYRDAIRYVHDQTVRQINLGLTPDEATERVRLPSHLRASPYLKELYGTVEWSVRSVFNGNLGWFDGNPSTLRPLSPLARAERVGALAGGLDGLILAIRRAADNEDYQWILELSDHALRLEPANEAVLSVRIAALKALGTAAINPNARHYYLSSALELETGLRFESVSNSSDALLRSLPMASMFDSMAVNLQAENTLDTNYRVGFIFTDTAETWTLWVRRGVLEVRQELLPDLDLQVEVDSLVFKKLLARQINATVAVARDFAFPVGNALAFGRFMKLFTSPRTAPEPAPFATLD